MNIDETVESFLLSHSDRADDTIRWYKDQFRAWRAFLASEKDWLDPDVIESFLRHECNLYTKVLRQMARDWATARV